MKASQCKKAYEVIGELMKRKTRASARRFALQYIKSVRGGLTFSQALDNLLFGISYFAENPEQDAHAVKLRTWLKDMTVEDYR